jgi:hypothetical protein
MAKTLRIARFLTPDLKEGVGCREMGKWGVRRINKNNLLNTVSCLLNTAS